MSHISSWREEACGGKPGNPLATDTDIVVVGELGMDARCTVGLAGAPMDGTDPHCQRKSASARGDGSRFFQA
jgi:hypothetical protein